MQLLKLEYFPEVVRNSTVICVIVNGCDYYLRAVAKQHFCTLLLLSSLHQTLV